MIKVLHFADYHLGMENYGHINPKTGFSLRIDDFLATLDFIIDYALGNEIDLVVFAGDAYKNRHPSPTLVREFSRRIYKLAGKIPVVLLVGNHDSTAVLEKANTLDIFAALNVPNVYVIRQPQILEIELQGKEKIQILGIPWLSRSELLKIGGENDIKISPEDFEKKSSEILSGVLEELKRKLNQSLKTVAVFHGSVEGGKFGAERTVMFGTDPVMPLKSFLDEAFSYVALGHLHSYQVLSLNPPVIYSGSPDRVDFSEEKEDKGFVLAKIGTKDTSFEFIKTPARPFLTLEINFTGREQTVSECLEKIKQKVKDYDFSNMVLKVILKGSKTVLDMIEEKEVKEILGEVYYLAGIYKNIEMEILREKNEVDVDLAPLSLIAEYLESKNYSETKKKKIKEVFAKLLEEIE